MRDLADQLREMLSGVEMLDELRASVRVAEPLYRRPSPDFNGSLGSNEFRRHVDLYADWELRTRALLRSIEAGLQYASQHGDADPGKTLRILAAVSLVSPLLRESVNLGLLEFRIGYCYWLLNRFADAIPHLMEAERALRGDIDEGFSRELLAMTYLVSSLWYEKKWDESLAAAERFLRRSRELQNHACEAQALRHIGLAQAELGREPALDNLEEALRSLDQSPEELQREYSVPGRARFLEDLATIARRRGRFERAQSIFRELTDVNHERADPAGEARALSEIAYTYLASGETERAVGHLKRAAELATQAGDHTNAARWRRQAATFSGGVPDIAAEPEPVFKSSASGSDAYETSTIVEALIRHERFKDALTLAEQVLAWALENNDLHLQIASLNNLAVCCASLDDAARAITAFRQGIKLADGVKDSSASLLLRGGLARAYLQAGKTKLAYDVLLSATVFADILLNETESMEVRQQIVSSLLPIQELLAYLLSRTDNHEKMIAVTERVRTRNLNTWMTAAYTVSQAASREVLSGLLRELRAVEVEFEVREVAGTTRHSDIRRISETRTLLRKKIDAELSAEGLASVDWSNRSPSNIGQDLANAIRPGDAALFLFGVSEGVCAAAVRMVGGNPETRGSLIEWTREDRLSVLGPWIRKEGSANAELTPDVFDESLRGLRERLFEPVAGLCQSWNIENLLVVPHGELALVPLWEILELSSARGALTVSTSLGVFSLCTRRSRSLAGSTLITGDVTGQLRHSRKEMEWVKAARSGAIVASTVEEFRRASEVATVIHVAAHGVYNPGNPYLSGIIVSEKDYRESWSSQYVAAPREFSHDRNPTGWPLLTAAECMANMSLDSCSLAVLSACESGVPRLHGGGEMTGLPSALILAGARSVVASLWRVNDAAAAALMHILYEILTRTPAPESVSLALREARSRLLDLSRRDVDNLLGPNHKLKEDYPFQSRYLSDAFHCFGAY